MTVTTTLDAPAKLTLSLRVTGVRDDGFHLIDAEMIELDLSDVVEITQDADGLEIVGPYAQGVPTDDTNLVARALNLANRRAHVRITKYIPHGGGLGGGSTDAACVLKWAGFTDLVAASEIGADVPFSMVGGRARVRGIGESVERLSPHAYEVTLIIPPLSVSTPKVYSAWDDLGGPRHESGNDLEPAAVVVEPELLTWKRRIADVVGTNPILAGSGATWFVHGHHRQLQEALPGAKVLLTRSR